MPRQRDDEPETTQPATAATEEEPSAKPARSRGRSRGSSAASSASTPTADFPEVETAAFAAGESPEPREQVGDVDELELPPPEPVVWTPERAGYMLRGAGFVLHSADSAARAPGGEELWRMTETDLEAMGPPLAAILNRYDAARRLAGMSEEAGLAFGMLAYAKRNLATRGRVVAALEAETVAAVEPSMWARSEEPRADGWREGRAPADPAEPTAFPIAPAE